MPNGPIPDPKLDYRLNSRGSLFIIVLRVKDVMTSLRCSRSHAYEVIRECRGEVVNSRLAFILPSQLRDWTLRQLGGVAPQFPMRAATIFKLPGQSDREALRTTAQTMNAGGAPLQITMPRTKPRGGNEGI